MIPQLLDAPAVADLLRCSVKTVEDMARAKKLPGIKPGGSWLFPASALATVLDAMAIEHTRDTPSPAPAQASAVLVSIGKVGKAEKRRPVLPGTASSLRTHARRALNAWDTTTLQQNSDGMLWQCMEALRVAVEATDGMGEPK